MPRRQGCLAGCTIPACKRGDITATGNYWRNLDDDDIRIRYERDQERPPRFGFVLKSKSLRWDDEGLSVNGSQCMCARCSIILHPDADAFSHVVRISLEGLRPFGVSLVASYDPVTEIGKENPCHFCLLPSEDDVDVIKMKLEMLVKNYVGMKPPKDEAATERARAQEAQYRAAFDIHMHVLSAAD